MPTCSRQTLVKDHAFLVKPAYYLKSLYGVRGFCVCDISVVQEIWGQWKFSGDKHKSLQVDTERTFHQRYPLVML